MAETPLLPKHKSSNKIQKTVWVLTWSVLAVPVLAVVVSALSVFSSDVGWAMVTALIVMPVAIALTLLLSLITVVLSLVVRFRYRSERSERSRWWVPLVIALVSAAVLPIVITILILTSR